MAERFFASSLLASGVTFALFWFMQALVAVDGGILDPTPAISVVPFVHVHQKPRPIKTRPPRPMLDDPNEKPLPPDFRTTTNDSTIDGIFAIDPLGDTNEPLGRDLFSERAPADGDAVPLVRISPDYPEGALRRGLEGRVLLEFTIGRSGAVENARVIAAEPNSIFNAAALKAVRQWRYNPKIKNGVAVEQPGIRIAIPFRREEPGR